MGVAWTKISEPGEPVTEYVSGAWRLSKEFYADGPSLFEWVLTSGSEPRFRQTFRTKKQATQWLGS